MPPKLSAAQIDEMMEELHTFVCSNAALLASRNGSSLCASPSLKAWKEEKKWYFFLHRSARALSESQKMHVLQTYVLLAKVASAASTSMAAPAAEQRRTQSRASTSAPAAEQRQLSLESCAAASTAASAAEQRRQQAMKATKTMKVMKNNAATKKATKAMQVKTIDVKKLLQDNVSIAERVRKSLERSQIMRAAWEKKKEAIKMAEAMKKKAKEGHRGHEAAERKKAKKQ